jgi:hypothetical protein
MSKIISLSLCVLVLSFMSLSGALEVQDKSKAGYINICVQAINNLYPGKVILENGITKVTVSESGSKINYFKSSVKIPFVSIKNYIKEYAESANGRAYIPEKALMIRLENNRTYGIWENEVGIMLSPDQKTDDLRGLRKLLKNVNLREPKDNRLSSSVLKLLLLIDKQGDIALSNLETFSS